MSAQTETTTDGVSVSFNSKNPHTTFWIELTFPVDERPEDVIGALNSIGFVENSLGKAPAVNGVDYAHLGKAGSGLFAGWTADEAVANESEARDVLSALGFADVPRNELGFADLI